MPDLINKLSSYAALIGVIGAIGGGFYAWGEFNTRLSAVENVSYETTDLSGITDDIKELNEKINDRVNALGASQEEDYQSLQEAMRSLAGALESLKADIAINAKAIEFNGIKIEEAIARSENPLAN
jgi:predicted  nucleic acid-binding Zn-ribbon protein